MQGELVFRACEEPLDVAAVHVQDQQSDDCAQHGDHHVMIYKPGSKGEGGAGPAGAQGHIPGQDGQDEEAAVSALEALLQRDVY